MYTAFKKIGLKKFVTAEMPSLGLSLIVAEAFFKFGSFILEAGAFLCTWCMVSYLQNKMGGAWSKSRGAIEGVTGARKGDN